jgi:hypothetical protein
MRQANAHARDGRWDDDLRSIRATYLERGGEFLVGLLDGEAVAMGALRRVSDTVAEIRRMRVDTRVQPAGSRAPFSPRSNPARPSSATRRCTASSCAREPES